MRCVHSSHSPVSDEVAETTYAVSDDFALMLRTYGHLPAPASAIQADAERV
jgi:hypothetical protein